MEKCKVDFSASVSALLSPEFRSQIEGELKKVFARDCDADWVLVSRCFGGFTPRLQERIVLGVEVRCADCFETHIVKLGQRKKVERDAQGWEACTKDRQIASRILSPVRYVPDLGNERVAVVYRDAYILFGLNQEGSRPETLETAAEWAVRDDRPDPLSVERAIAHIFTDLGRWFYPGATEDRDAMLAFYRERLRIERRCTDSVSETFDDPILPVWSQNEDRRLLRRDAVWLLCGRDPPDADPVTKPARYLDPVDFVSWMVDSKCVPCTVCATNRAHFPNSLVGRSHGDLHGRNVLVGVRRGEVEYPAVFDYGEMGTSNVLAWDFAKLETELKIRLLPPLLANSDVRTRLLGKESVGLRCDRSGLPSERAERAERVSMFMAFEEWLHGLTSRIHTREQAETLAPLPTPYLTGVNEVDHLAAILLRVRKEAARWLGFEHYQRQDKWRDEYYFALAVYGLLNVRWDYDIAQTEFALVSAGFAAARMPLTPTLLRSCISFSGALRGDFPSYRVPLAVLHRLWKSKEYATAKEYVDQSLLDIERHESGAVKTMRVRSDVMHAVPLVAEGALIEIESGLSRAVEDILETLRVPAREFCDFETLGRIGRLFKDAGDARWEDSKVEFAELVNGSAAQMYRKALTVYEEAFQEAGDYYTGINAATLALLTHDRPKAIALAGRVAEICKRMRDVPRDERFWVFATEGEASLIVNVPQAAERFYRDALLELSPGQGGMANSAYKQLCRLWRALPVVAEPSLRVFEQSEFRSSLTPILGRDITPKTDEQQDSLGRPNLTTQCDP